MNEPLDELYLTWLYSQVASARYKNPRRTYWALLRQLYTTEFVWFVPNDDNRVEDGKYLRYEFCEKVGVTDVDQNWFNLGCSVLEMLVALARRLAFQTDEPVDMWFWKLLSNLGLRKYNDASQPFTGPVSDILDRIIWRTYNWDGHGGLFPLQRAEKDQTKVEIWYQMCAYLIETMD